jgi:transglutaminase-like putative cysteine protease
MTRSPRDGLFDTVVVLVASAVLLGGFAPLFDGVQWAVTVLSVVVPVAAVIAVVRLKAPSWGTPAGALAALVLVTWVFVPGTTVFGVPTPRSLTALADLLNRSRTVIVEEVAPIAPPDSVVLLVALAVAVTFVLADAVARQTWRVPLLGLLWATLLVVPSVISMQMPAWWVFLGTAAAWLWLWWSESPHVGVLPTGAAALTAAGALLVALALPVVSPEIEPTSSDFGVTESQVFGTGINPMIELGRNLRQSKPRRVLTYSTDGTSGQYLKVATLRQFNGRTWSPSPVLGDLDVEGVDDLEQKVETEEQSTNVRIESLRSSYLPVPYPATQIRGLDGDWQWLRDGSTVRAQGRTTTEDQTYTVTSIDRRPTAEQIRRADPGGRALDTYRTLPDGVPGLVSRLARAEAGGATNDYDRMVQLQDWLRTEFSYSVESPVEEGYDGNGLDVMEEFLRQKTGYCVHFASTLAVMGRVLGVPTRVAVGYAPGDSVVGRTATGTTYGVDSDDLHAWTEVHFDGIGWVPFDATPGIGEGTEFAEEVTAGEGAGEDAEVTENQGGSERSLDAQDDQAAVQAEQETGSSWRPALLAIAVLSVLGAVPGVVRQLRRRRRWAAGQDSSEPLWSEIADTARDLGIEPDPAETPRGFARRLGTHGVAAVPLDEVVSAVERDRYAGEGRSPSRLAAAQQVVESLEAASGRRTRWLARIVPRSLLR